MLYLLSFTRGENYGTLYVFFVNSKFALNLLQMHVCQLISSLPPPPLSLSPLSFRATSKEHVDEFSIDYMYTPFYFSRVKSYSHSSNSLL